MQKETAVRSGGDRVEVRGLGQGPRDIVSSGRLHRSGDLSASPVLILMFREGLEASSFGRRYEETRPNPRNLSFGPCYHALSSCGKVSVSSERFHRRDLRLWYPYGYCKLDQLQGGLLWSADCCMGRTGPGPEKDHHRCCFLLQTWCKVTGLGAAYERSPVWSHELNLQEPPDLFAL